MPRSRHQNLQKQYHPNQPKQQLKLRLKWRRSLRWLIWLWLTMAIILIIRASDRRGSSNYVPLQHRYTKTDNFGNEPWASLLGVRMAKLRAKIATIDRVVLVPDRETFLAALATWDLRGRFPILIDDEQYAPMFIRRFQPAEILRLPSVNPFANNLFANLEPSSRTLSRNQLLAQLSTSLGIGKVTETNLRNIIAKTWGVPTYPLLTTHWQKLRWVPAGVVITSIKDPAAPAAAALAAAWGQPLTFLDEDFGQPNISLDFDRWQVLQKSVETKVAETGYDYQNLGDAIDTITIARQMAVKYRPIPKAKEDFAVTDGLARKANGVRWAIAGWIFGSLERSIYQAMCSIFLDYQTALMVDTYPNESPWNFYNMQQAIDQLERVGIKTKLIATPNADVEHWREIGNSPSDLLFVNSSGSPSAFTVNKGEAKVTDIPQWQIPTAIHFIHSWSAVTPDDVNTIAGRWLANGTYAYFGSVNEPYLQAFVPPNTIISRILESVPFLVAVRQYQSSPWKVAAIGDPLMMILPPRKRLAPKAFPYPQP